MAHTLSARKRIRQTEKKRLMNKSNKSRMKTAIKKCAVAMDTNTNVEASLKDAVSTIAKTARKGAIHKKQAARKISRLTLKANALKANA